MLFNSLQFLIFFPIVVCVYFLIPDRIKYLWLLAASYYFYMCWNARYALLLLFSTAVTWCGGLLLDSISQSGDRERRRKEQAVAGIVCAANLAILFFFKYFDYAFANLNRISEQLFHITLNNPGLDLILPVGISFYTVQALGYTIDVYRGRLSENLSQPAH